ncbi:MAG: ChaN family lipoprotein [Candidatus Delongbacteria bacterium]|jgi:uncharacterized iron-regulated protein|nr:ChaN family lipoprotein [Candidatus Delongbacteria bacterium]
MKIFKILTIFIIVWSSIMVAEIKNYKLYNSRLDSVDYSSMVDELKDCDVIFFGELHNSIEAHNLELKLTQDLFLKRNGKITLGAEMLESDNQLTIDEYFSDFYKTNKFEGDVRLWPNYKTDYKPLVEFAKDNMLKFIATNIPRRYASMVFYGGFEALDKLSDRSKEYFVPKPIEFDPELSCYKKMASMSMPAMGHDTSKKYFAEAQAIKDATMGYFISKNFEEDKLFIHYNGSFHSDDHVGIIWYLNKYRPNLKIKTLTTILAKDINDPDKVNIDKADFILVVDEKAKTSY